MSSSEQNETIPQKFAAEWAEGNTPDIAEFIQQLPQRPDESLRNELIVLDIEHRNKRELPMEATSYADLGDDAVAFAETAVAARISHNRRIGKITLGVAFASGIVACVGYFFDIEIFVIAFGFVSVCAAMLCVSPLQGGRFTGTDKYEFSPISAKDVVSGYVAYEVLEGFMDFDCD